MERNPQIDLAEKYINNTNISIFLTGKAGTGKTTLLHHIAETCPKRNVIVAPTGVAAVNAGGVTIHSFFQLPFDPFLPDIPELVTEYQLPEHKKQLRKEKLNIIRTLDLLIIDEISMVRADLLDAIDDCLRRYRRSRKPFGGVQLLMIGDIQQLPPVVTDAEKPYMDRVYPSPFFFNSKALQQLQFVTIELTTVYRQQDAHFISILNDIRDNKFSPDILQQLNQRYIPNFAPPANDHYIQLTTHNHQADRINQKEMDQLPAEVQLFEASVSGNFPESSTPTSTRLQLKKGAQVMFVKNDSSGAHRYYNGKIGTVQDIITKDGKKIISVVDENGDTILVDKESWENIKYEIDPKDKQIKQKVDGTFTQYPLRLAWAVTIHKAQGLTFDHVIINASQAFSYGQVYVALSRCRTLEGLVLSAPISSSNMFANQDIEHFTQNFTSVPTLQQYLPFYQQNYYFEILKELFDFSLLDRELTRIHSIFQNHLKKTYQAQTATLSSSLITFQEKVVSVAEKFLLQASRIAQTATTPIEENAFLHERILRAADYFFGQLTMLNDTLSDLFQVEVSNQEVKQDLEQQAENYTADLQLKISLFTIFKEQPFDPQRYLNTKNSSLLNKTKEKKTSKKKEVDYSKTYADNAHPELVKRLTVWRTEKYQTAEVPAFVILSQKALLGIADSLPASEKELLKVPGIGKVKVEQFGSELCQIVRQYCYDKGLTVINENQ